MELNEEISTWSSAELHPYLSLFHQHLQQIQEHLKGIAHQDAYSPSVVGNVLWTGAEKNTFFHALSVYSRFRPDLIAVCVGTKNEVEVMEYLSMLEEGSRNYRVGVSCRRELPIAHEVSDSWVAWEENSAERLRANEERWTELPSEGDTMMGRRYEADEAANGVSGYDTQSGSIRATSLGGVNRLTHGHLFVLGSILKRGEDKQPGSVEETAPSTLDRNLTFDHRAAGIGSNSPTGTTPDDTSSGITKSQEVDILGRSVLTLSCPDPDEAQSQELTPRSRRRLTKRMYMRRKRAQLKGEELDTTIDRLRSGPRKKVTQNISVSTILTHGRPTVDSDKPVDAACIEAPVPTGQSRAMGSDEDDTADDDPVSGTSTTRVQFQGIHSRFSSHNVTIETIAEVGLDLFDLRKLGRLLRQFISGYDSNLTSGDASIDVDTLSLLSEIIKDFLVQLMARVITLEEEQRRLRGTTKVWRRHTDTAGVPIVNASAIQFALKTMGLTAENKNQVFADLLGEEYNLPSHFKTGYDDNERPINSPNLSHRHPLHQDVCPPHYFVSRVQQSLDSVSEVANDLMDDSASEDLASQLEEEDALDEGDSFADQHHENWLWREIRPPARYSHRLKRT